MNNDPIFPDGMAVFLPREGAPSFIKANLSVHAEKFFNFLRQMKSEGRLSDKGFLSFDIKKSQKGTLYVQLNTYKKADAAPAQPAYQSSISAEDKAILDAHRSHHNRTAPPPDDINPEDIPF